MAAIGFIETYGLIGAIEAADAMLKAADVRLLERTQVGSGLVTITVHGEVSAVKAAVDAAEATLHRIEGSVLVSKHVIPRPDQGISSIIATEPSEITKSDSLESTAHITESQNEPSIGSSEEDAQIEPVMEEALHEGETEVRTEPEVAPVHTLQDEMPQEDTSIKEQPAKPAPERHTISQLKKMKVANLRKIARSMPELGMNNEEIKKANKKSLIEAITNAYKNIEE